MKTTLHTDNHGNLILQNGKPQMYRFAGGYASFDADTNAPVGQTVWLKPDRTGFHPFWNHHSYNIRLNKVK